MMRNQPSSGISAVGDLAWGTHFCQFYDTKGDLADTLVPFFKAGLENNEKCLWVTSEPFREDDARSALRSAVSSLDAMVERGQIEIIDYQTWYRKTGNMEPEDILKAWIQREQSALNDGFTGLRLTGNTFWLQGRDWDQFTKYEAMVNRGFRGRRIVALCTYCLGRCNSSEVLDVVRNHQFAVARRAGEWEVIESASLKIAKEELWKLNESLEARVLEQTAALRQALADKTVLFREVHHRVKNNLQLTCSLLMLKARQFKDEEMRRAFAETVSRIKAMSLVHEALYRREDSTSIDMSDYLRRLCDGLLETHGAAGRIALETPADAIFLDLNAAVPVGLIATEVVSNALKHAFPGNRTGRITVACTKADGLFRLSIRDDGIGMEEAVPSRLPMGAGLSLIRSLASQLRANAAFGRQDGTVFTLFFPAG